jgi:hypothetical protein
MNATQTDAAAPAVAGRVIENVSHGEVLERQVHASEFDYLFPNLVGDADSHLPSADAPQVIALLRRLGGAMAEPVASGAPPSPIPAVYTYWGQFIDHDLTLEDSADASMQQPAVAEPGLQPVDPETVRAQLGNARQPYLNLDSLYGDGPKGAKSSMFYDGAFMRLGTLASPAPGQPVPCAEDPDERDLPGRRRVPNRATGRDEFPARIGDSRNDENLVVAQLHLAYLRFHNAVAHAIQVAEPRLSKKDLLARAQQFTRHTHQWLIVHDYLRTVTVPGTVDWVLSAHPGLYLSRFPADRPEAMPLEFSVAAFRFGHSQIRNSYDYNRNFGDPGFVAPRASLEQLFQFTGRGGFIGGATGLPMNWAIEWDRFVDKADPDGRHFARAIDTQLADDLSVMRNEPRDLAGIQEHLAKRNLLRGYLLSLPTGEAVARELAIRPLTRAELLRNTPAGVRSALTSPQLSGRTPLWYYVLKEAEVLTGGSALGPVGSRLVAETIIGLIRHDPDSFLSSMPAWGAAAVPTLGTGPEARTITSLPDMLEVAGVMPPS